MGRAELRTRPEAEEPRSAESRATRWTLVAALAGLGLVLVLLALGAGTYALLDQSFRVDDLETAYERATDRVASVQNENARLKAEHATIGQAFEELQERVAAAEPTRPGALSARELARYEGAGFLVPRRLPRVLGPRTAALAPYGDGYSITWRGRVSLFATRGRDPGLAPLRRARRGQRTAVVLRGRRVTRIASPVVVYAWREARRSYTVLATPRLDRAARALIRGLR